MKPLAITVSRFRGWKSEHRITLDAPITSIVAENGRGKSSLLNAIEWCLYGAEVTIKGSGIDERQNWELRTRVEKDDSEPTVVMLELDTAEGSALITRKRSANAKAREADQFTVQDSNGTVLAGDSAETWLVDSGMPDWETYRRAHCFHQEAARQRVVSTTERSAILTALLGLDDDLALRNTIESIQPSKLFTEIDKTLEALNKEARRALDFPRQRLSEIENEATEMRLDANQLSDSNANTLRSRLVARARELATRLGLEADFPDEKDARAVRDWATKWPATARFSSPALVSLEGHRRRAAEFDQLLIDYQQVDSTWQEVQSKLQQERQSGEDEAQRIAKVTVANDKLTEANTALEQNNAKVKLLVDAKAAIEEANHKDECPVCETDVPGLKERLGVEIETLRSDDFVALQAAQESARAKLDRTKVAQDVLVALVSAEATARGRVDEQRDKLRDLLTIDESITVHDILAEGKKQRESIQSEITGLEALSSDRDQRIEDHQANCERLDLIEKWLGAAERAESSIDLSALPKWSELNEAIDELAGFGSDLEFLGSLARDIQAERSESRAAEVNKALGKYYALITQDDTALQVSVHTTAQHISYDLVDESGLSAVPILNQAAINALSLAVLFSQSEDRAMTGPWELVAVDDPAQSLDSEKQAGLARAIEELSNHCSILVATVPGHLSERLRDYVSKRRHMVTLGPWSRTDGACIEDEIDL